MTTLFSWLELSQSFVQVKYLKRIERFNESVITDYYFSCHIEGLEVQWGVNGSSLGGYVSSDVGTAVVSESNEFNFTTSLISAKPKKNAFLLDSILIIFTGNRQIKNFEVSCNNNMEINITSNQIEPEILDFIPPRQGTEIQFEYALAAQLVQNYSQQTSIFVCRSNSTSQDLGIPSIRAFGFSSSDQLGATRNLKNDTLICDRLRENRAQRGMRRRRKKIDLVLKIVLNKPNEGNG